MKKDKIVFIILAVIVIGVIVLINFVKDGDSGDREGIECIAEDSLLIVSRTCGHCADQLKVLGEDKSKFNILYIDDNPGILDEYNLRGVPSWVINEKVYSGVKSIEELKTLTGC